MTIVGAGEVPINPTFPRFRSEVLEQTDASASEAGGRFREGFGRAVRGIGAGIAASIAAVGVGVGAVVGSIGSKGISRALNIQDAKAQLTGLGHSAESVGTIMESALASVKGTAFGLDQSAQIAASSVAAGIAPGEALTRVLKLTADSATIAKAPLSELGSIINKVATNQRLTTETMQQFQDRGIPILQAVAKQMGVTADEAAQMVSRGEIDFATFQNALESSVGGAALSSGTTARGALANIGAAFSRLGAMFTQSGVDNAPGLFTSVANAVDRAAEALKPYAAALSDRVGPAMQALAGWIDRIEFGRIVGEIRNFYLNAVDVKDLLLTGFTENETLLPPAFADGLQTAHRIIAAVADGVRSMFAAFTGGDASGVTGQFSSIGTSLQTLQPAVQSFISAMPNIGQAVATLAAGALTVLTQVLSFLADHVDTIIALMPLIVGGFLLWRAASFGVLAANQQLTLTQLRMLPLTTANTFARLAAARAELQLAAATGASTGAQTGGMFATVRSTAATVASTVAMGASRAAIAVATAAQWAWNAAMTANPIGIIIAAIVALVAGLVWFFTQTDLGRAIWANFTAAIAAAATWLWENILSPVFTAIGAIFVWLYQNVIAPIVAGIVLYAQAWAAIFMWLWQTILQPLFSAIGAGIAFVYENGIRPTVEAIVAGIMWAGDTIGGIKKTIDDTLVGIGMWLFSAGRDLIQGFVDGINGAIGIVGDAIGGVMDFVGGFFPHSPAKRGPFSGSGWTAVLTGGEALSEQFFRGLDRGPDPTVMLNKTMAALAAVPPVASSAAATAPSSVQGRGSASFTQNNYFAEMDSRIAVDAAGQSFAAAARRAGA